MLPSTFLLQTYIESRIPVSRIAITNSSSSSGIHATILNKLTQSRKKNVSSKWSHSQRNMFLCDDLHMSSEVHSSSSPRSPVLELLTSVVDHTNMPDIKRNYLHNVSTVQLLATCTISGARRLTPQLARHLRVVPFFPLSYANVHSILYQNSHYWLDHFAEKVGNIEALSHVSSYTVISDAHLTQTLQVSYYTSEHIPAGYCHSQCNGILEYEVYFSTLPLQAPHLLLHA